MPNARRDVVLETKPTMSKQPSKAPEESKGERSSTRQDVVPEKECVKEGRTVPRDRPADVRPSRRWLSPRLTRIGTKSRREPAPLRWCNGTC